MHTMNPPVTLTIAGDGTLKYTGGYHLSNLVDESNHEYAHAYAWSCPFEGVTDGAFDSVSNQMPLDCVRTVVIGASLGALHANIVLRDDAERSFDYEIRRAIAACKTPGDNF